MMFGPILSVERLLDDGAFFLQQFLADVSSLFSTSHRNVAQQLLPGSRGHHPRRRRTAFEDLFVRGKPTGIEELEQQRREEGLTASEAAEASGGKPLEHANADGTDAGGAETHAGKGSEEVAAEATEPNDAAGKAASAAATAPDASKKTPKNSCMGVAGKEWLAFHDRPTGILADTDLLFKTWVWNPKDGACPPPPDAAARPILHPRFLFSRKVHKLKITLTDLASKQVLWDAVYAGSPENLEDPNKALDGTRLSEHASYGSAYELSPDAPPTGGGSVPGFRYFCPPYTNKSKFKVCFEDADTTGYFSECHILQPGRVKGADTPNPDLVPRVPHTGHWDGMLPVRGLGYVAGGAFRANVTADSAQVVKENAKVINAELKLGLVKVKEGPQSTARFGRPRYPLYIGAQEDESKTPTVGLDLFGDCTPEEEKEAAAAVAAEKVKAEVQKA